MVLRKFLKGYVELYVAKFVGRIFWPPSASAVMAEGENNDILVLNTGDSYELPGGIINYGENMREAAKREAKEETGFDVEIHDLMDVRVGETNGSIQFFFKGKVVGGEKNGSWEGKPEFVSKDQLDDLIWRHEHAHIHEYLFPDRE